MAGAGGDLTGADVAGADVAGAGGDLTGADVAGAVGRASGDLTGADVAGAGLISEASAAVAAASLAVCYGQARMLAECRTWTVRSAEAVPWLRPAGRPAPGAAAARADIAVGGGLSPLNRAQAASQASAARGLQALARALSGDAVAALGMFSRVPELSALVPAEQADELTIRGVLRLWTGDLPGADDDLSAAAGLLGDRTRLRFPSLALSYLAETEFRLGRWADAAAHADLAASLAEDACRDADLPLARSLAAQIAAVRGAGEQASALVKAAEQAARRTGTVTAMVLAGSARSVLGFARDDPAEVLAATARIATLGDAASYDDPAASWWRPLRIWALLRSQRATEAAAALAAFEAATAAGRPAGDLAAMHCARLRAALALSGGDQPRAQRILEQASGVASRLPMALPRVLFDLDRARCLARGRNRPAALARLRAAHRVLVDLGARPFAEAAQAELAALGLRDRPGADGRLAADGLTEQELQVARLVAAGLSNREAAARLYLSPKTIEYHLARIFAKLGVRTRYQLAARFPASERESAGPAVTVGDQPGQGRDGDLGGRP